MIYNSFSQAGIKQTAVDKNTGEFRTICPKCSPHRTKKNEECLSANIKGTWICHHCDWTGCLKNSNDNGNGNKPSPKKKYTLPNYILKPLSEKAKQYLFETRKISSSAVERNLIGQDGKWLTFPYIKGGKAINIKHRDFEKNFFQTKRAEKILYGYDDIDDASTIIVEGEMDKLAIETAGLKNCVSVPDGAPPINAKKYSSKFSYLDICQPRLDEVKKFVLAVDNDEPGQKLETELIKRLGQEKCSSVEWPDGCKDANDVLIQYGPKKLKQIIEEAKPCEHLSKEWPNPEPVRCDLLPVETLSLSIIPEPFQTWLQDISHRMQCPLDFTAVSALVMTGAVIGAGCGIKPKQRDDWKVIPNLWGAIIARPAMLKTPSMDESQKPITRLEVASKEEFDSSMREYGAEFEMFKAKKEFLKREMVKAAGAKAKAEQSGPSPEKLTKEYAELEEPKKSIWKRYKTNDATIEKMGELLSENNRGILLFRDELVGLFSSWDKEGREPDRTFFLESWNGYGSSTSDRIGRGTVFVKNLCISVFGGIQPSKLIPYLNKAIQGNENDGLVQRLQMLVYPDEPKNWKLIDEYPDTAAKKKSFEIIKSLSEMDFTLYGASQEDGKDIPYFRFSDDAQKVFNKWLTKLQQEKLQQDDEPIILEHLGKYRSLMPSLALVFHLVDIADGGSGGHVSIRAAEKAVAWCEYLESHMRRVYGLVTDISGQAAAKLSKKIKNKKLPDGFTVRDVYRKGWSILDIPENAQLACDELVDLGWLRSSVTKPEFQQREKVEYFMNPKVNVQE